MNFVTTTDLQRNNSLLFLLSKTLLKKSCPYDNKKKKKKESTVEEGLSLGTASQDYVYIVQQERTESNTAFPLEFCTEEVELVMYLLLICLHQEPYSISICQHPN